MPALKWGGVILLLLCGLALSTALCAFERARLEQARGFHALCSEIRRQIACFSHPVSRILGSIEQELLSKCRIRVRNEELSASLANTSFYLPDEAQERLRAFADSLGGAYREEQLRSCEACIAYLQALCERLEGETAHRIQLARLLPLSITGALALMLI